MATFDADELGWRDAYKLLTGLVVPRPIAWVGTRSPDGVANLAPYSFFTVASADPPTVLFCPQLPDGREDKDSLANAEAAGEFTVSFVSHALAVRMNETAATVPADVDEFELAGVTPARGIKVAAPYVVEAPAAIECRLADVHRLEAAAVVFGEVVAFHVTDEALDGTRVDPAVTDVIGRLGGPNYSTVRDRLSLERPA